MGRKRGGAGPLTNKRGAPPAAFLPVSGQAEFSGVVGETPRGYRWRVRSALRRSSKSGKGNTAAATGAATVAAAGAAAGAAAAGGGGPALSKIEPNEEGGGSEGVDPILLGQLGEHRYTFVRPNGSRIVYSIESLVDWFLKTGEFTEPETRLPFSDTDLEAIDSEARKIGLNRPSVLEAKRNPSSFTQERSRMDALTGLERCLGELVSELMSIIESADAEEGELRLVMHVFPSFADLFRQLSEADAEHAKLCMSHFVTFLKGPPNRPTKQSVFMGSILSFLDSCTNGCK